MLTKRQAKAISRLDRLCCNILSESYLDKHKYGYIMDEIIHTALSAHVGEDWLQLSKDNRAKDDMGSFIVDRLFTDIYIDGTIKGHRELIKQLKEYEK